MVLIVKSMRDVANLGECFFNIWETLGWSQAPQKLGIIPPPYTLRTHEVEKEESETQAYPKLHSEVEARLGYSRPCPKNKLKRKLKMCSNALKRNASGGLWARMNLKGSSLETRFHRTIRSHAASKGEKKLTDLPSLTPMNQHGIITLRGQQWCTYRGYTSSSLFGLKAHSTRGKSCLELDTYLTMLG